MNSEQQPISVSDYSRLDDLQDLYWCTKFEANKAYRRMKELYEECEKYQKEADAIRAKYGLPPAVYKKGKRKMTDAQETAKQLKFDE